MTPATQLALGGLLLAGGLGLLAHWYLRLPRSGFYNRPEERDRLADRPRLDAGRFRLIIGLLSGGLALLLSALS